MYASNGHPNRDAAKVLTLEACHGGTRRGRRERPERARTSARIAGRDGRRRPHVGEGLWRCPSVETGCEAACERAQSVGERRVKAENENERGKIDRRSRIGRRVRRLGWPNTRQIVRADGSAEECTGLGGDLRSKSAAKEQNLLFWGGSEGGQLGVHLREESIQGGAHRPCVAELELE